jgi:1-acyl-sn-glycerol-3-phosphate acyltransferase
MPSTHSSSKKPLLNFFDSFPELLMGKTPEKLTHFDPVFTRRYARLLMPLLEQYFRLKLEGLEHLPSEPFIGVGTHGGGMNVPECYLWLGKYHLLNRKPDLIPLVHSQFFNPLLGATPLMPIYRKFGLAKATRKNAEQLLKSGYAIQIYPGGDLDAYRPFHKRNTVEFAGRTGYVRLALRTGKPILPVVAIGGAETAVILSDGKYLAQFLQLDKIAQLQIAPLVWSYPRGLRFGIQKATLPIPAQITISVLPPIRVDHYEPTAENNEEIVRSIDQLVRRRMQDRMNELAKGRIPVIGKVR